jgi:glycosyltransferase involved in cell wall biosynthesis
MGKDAPDVDWYGRDTAFLGTQQTTIGWLKADFPDVWDKRFHHREQISPERVRAIQQGALFNIIPSTWDVFNFTVIEAMSSGRPVICSNGAGASELIEDGISGFVYAAEDSSALARTLQRASSMSESDRREMAAQARHRLAVLLDPEAITTARLNAYAAAGARQAVPRLHKHWVRDLCSAGPIGTDHLCFLDNLPLKSIMTYAGQRTLGKVTGR